ncbi:caspase family protein [Mesobacterium pallidum]|uniref:caspase family protein n=1 Tax=Mesobacterium pallidum TaxID=2872037 RepID=UPI001EE23DAB|nr:caspase family protein [Mesobacterium pallidum]
MWRAALLSLGLASPALAENYALLVGASTYDNLEERFWLKGPANDVDLVATYLTTTSPVPFDAGNVMLLADGLEGGTKPTLAAIRAGFAAITAQLQPGDFVYLHFSGHGTQGPALDPSTEIDGLDEMFLPVDIGPWNDTVGTVENALIDDEIGTLITAMRDTGATVWAVFDSCHSGTVTRAAPSGEEEVRMRKLDPSALGVPEAAMDAVQTRALPDPRARPQSPAGEALAADAPGGFIAFYAAQTNETTPEKRLPKGQPGRRAQGVFTYTIFETLAQNPGVTYRQLGQEVLRRYAVQNLALSTPMFEGDLDAVVFSGEAGTRVTQWPVREGDFGLTLNAGALQGLGAGDILAILPTAASGEDDALGYVEVAFSDTFTAELEPIDHAGLAAIDPYDLPRGTYARKLADGVDFTLTVALPDPAVPLPGALPDALAQLETEATGRLRLVPAGSEADIRLAVMPQSDRPDAIWMLPGSGFFDPEAPGKPPSIGTAGRDGAEIAALMQENFETMARAINLLKLGGSYGGSDLSVDLKLQTRSRTQRELTDLDLTAVPRLIPDDQVHVLARNNEDFPVDANVLHIGSDYSISHFYSGRLQPGDTLKKGLFRVTNEGFGRDRVVIILTPAQPQSAVEDLAFLAQSAVEVTRGAGSDGSGFNATLRAAGFGTVTRGVVALDDDSGPAPVILQYDIDAVPGE